MRRRSGKTLVVGMVAVAAVACSGGGSGGSGSSAPSGSSGTASGATKASLTVGLLVDKTGPAASGQTYAEEGLKAGIAAAAKQGYKIKYVVADTQTSPSAALSGAQKLVQQDHVDVVFAQSAIFFAAAPYLTRAGIPVIGAAQDGPEWVTSKNMFAVYGVLHTEKVNDMSAQFIKKEGGTNLGSLGYDISPTSAEAAKAGALAMESIGLKAGYVNAKFPFGSTNVQPVAIAMKNAGVDALTPLTDPNTGFALVTALDNLGVKLNVTLLATGYGADLLQAGPGALKAAQNVNFSLFYQPMEMNTPATNAFKQALADVGFTKLPTPPAYNMYASVLMLVQGLAGANNDTSKSAIISGLSQIHDFDAGGLYGSHHLDPSDRTNLVVGPSNCQYFVKLKGDSFQPIEGALPLCGKNTGQTVSP